MEPLRAYRFLLFWDVFIFTDTLITQRNSAGLMGPGVFLTLINILERTADISTQIIAEYNNKKTVSSYKPDYLKRGGRITSWHMDVQM